jgi:hypothetical protein
MAFFLMMGDILLASALNLSVVINPHDRLMYVETVKLKTESGLVLMLVMKRWLLLASLLV